MRLPRFLTSVLGLSLCACAGGLTVTRINSEQSKPNNVWVFFTVEQGDEPVAGLEADDFEIYEDDSLVSQYESQQVIQNPDVAAVMYTLLLLDMSGSVTQSGQSDQLVDAAAIFSERVGKSQKVAVYAFDGSDKIHAVTRFTETQGSVAGGLEGLRSYQAKDPSTNLHGAVPLALQELDEALHKDKRPLKFGTLVVFTDGTDRAGRVSREEMLEQLRSERYAGYEVYAIGVGAELEESQLAGIGRDGTELATDPGKVRSAFERVADRIDAHSRRFYLLSYCTPARKGAHDVRITAVLRDEKGRRRRSGSLEYRFTADKFGPPPACNPNREPHFSLERVDVAASDSGSRRTGGSVRVGATAGSKGSAGNRPTPRGPGG